MVPTIMATTTMPNPHPTWYLPVAASAALVFWASAFVGTRVALASFPPGELALYRYTIASLILLAVACYVKPKTPSKPDAPRLIALGIIGIGIYGLCLNYGQQTVSAGAASFIVNTAPLFSLLIAHFYLRERLPWLGWLGVAVGLVGVGMISFAEADVGLSHGALLVFIAALCWALYQIMQKPLFPTYGSFAVVCYAIWSGTLFFLPFAPSLVENLSRAPLTHHLIVLYLGVLPGAVSFLAWSYVLEHMSVSKATPLLYLVPVLSLLIAWVTIGEQPAVLSVGGGLVAIAGVALSRLAAAHTANPSHSLTVKAPEP
jgi:drug/metabolite transporter (DMT)-like permease